MGNDTELQNKGMQRAECLGRKGWYKVAQNRTPSSSEIALTILKKEESTVQPICCQFLFGWLKYTKSAEARKE